MKRLKEIYNDKIKLAALMVKGMTAVVGGSLVLESEHPYITLLVLMVGAAASEYLLFLEKKKNE